MGAIHHRSLFALAVDTERCSYQDIPLAVSGWAVPGREPAGHHPGTADEWIPDKDDIQIQDNGVWLPVPKWLISGKQRADLYQIALQEGLRAAEAQAASLPLATE